ncbi:hypothetical protein FB451DRAFT_611371 [Mycena latifolia]|nr:hypothetical protein FB451DRAFT_611371 [Mycena latifolia]
MFKNAPAKSMRNTLTVRFWVIFRAFALGGGGGGVCITAEVPIRNKGPGPAYGIRHLWIQPRVCHLIEQVMPILG